MENTLPKSIQAKLKVIGIYQLVGGIIGLGLTVGLISRLTIPAFQLIVLLLAAIALYVYSIYCGALLLRKNISGLSHSLINQFLQLISFSLWGFSFEYISGVFLQVGFDYTNSFLITFHLGISQWQLALNGNNQSFILNLNLVALFLILFIEKVREEINKERIDKQITSIGR